MHLGGRKFVGRNGRTVEKNVINDKTAASSRFSKIMMTEKGVCMYMCVFVCFCVWTGIEAGN